MKRIFDIGVALVAIVVASPLLCLIALVIRVDSPGPVLYRGSRIGRFGRPFAMYKFRTMVADADRIGGSSTPTDDPRVTRVGAILRRYKLDELPQLWNVLKGEMSLVGPRPQVAWAVERYTSAEMLVLAVRPGITDPASLRFRNEGELLRGSTDPDRDYMEQIHPEKMRLSLAYARHHSLLGDIVLLFQTLRVWTMPKGAG